MWIFHSHSMFKSSEMTQQSTIIAVIVFMWHDMLDLYTHVKQCANWFLFAHASTTIIHKFNGFTSSKRCDGGVTRFIYFSRVWSRYKYMHHHSYWRVIFSCHRFGQTLVINARCTPVFLFPLHACLLFAHALPSTSYI